MSGKIILFVLLTLPCFSQIGTDYRDITFFNYKPVITKDSIIVSVQNRYMSETMVFKHYICTSATYKFYRWNDVRRYLGKSDRNYNYKFDSTHCYYIFWEVIK